MIASRGAVPVEKLERRAELSTSSVLFRVGATEAVESGRVELIVVATDDLILLETDTTDYAHLVSSARVRRIGVWLTSLDRRPRARLLGTSGRGT